LPVNARVFMTGMIGTTNGGRLGNYYYLTYYLFPREVAVSLDEPRFTMNGIQGRSTESDAEIQANGFDVRADLTPDGKCFTSPPRPMCSEGKAANPRLVRFARGTRRWLFCCRC
jgi:hypothetical protein